MNIMEFTEKLEKDARRLANSLIKGIFFILLYFYLLLTSCFFLKIFYIIILFNNIL